MNDSSEPRVDVTFGRFQVLPHRRELRADGQPVKLGGRVFDLLMVLIEARGAVVSKDTLLKCAWPDRIVEEHNLQAQICALRGALGPERDLIRTIAGRGYQFTGDIRISAVAALHAGISVAVPEQMPLPTPVPPRTNLPEPLTGMIGREEALADLLCLTETYRLVTLTGAGGIGKTRLALALGRRKLPGFPDGVWLAELSPLSDPGLLPAAVAAAIGLELGGEVSAQRLAQALADRRLLLVLDTCEHVIAAAAALAEAVLQAGSGTQIIATSREKLHVDGEQVYTVPPLAVPDDDAAPGAGLLHYSAVRLFLERAQAAQPRVAPDQFLIGATGTICRCLDGIPLAIEFAAARAATLGIEALAERLDDRFQLLTGGRRTALPRHQTLRAMLDWSYEPLTGPERVVLRRLAVFAGAFTLEAASAVVAAADIAPGDVIEGLTKLIDKSLVVADVKSSVAHYRLLRTTRAYAREKLAISGEESAVARRHADYCRGVYCRDVTAMAYEFLPSTPLPA